MLWGHWTMFLMQYEHWNDMDPQKVSEAAAKDGCQLSS